MVASHARTVTIAPESFTHTPLGLFSDGAVAVVAGASRGIGAAIAKELAAEGAHVVATYNGDEAGAKETANEIESRSGSCTVRHLDVRDEESVRSLFRDVRTELGGVDILVSNAGVTRDGYLASMSVRKFDEVIAANLRGCLVSFSRAPSEGGRRPGSIWPVFATTSISPIRLHCAISAKSAP